MKNMKNMKANLVLGTLLGAALAAGNAAAAAGWTGKVNITNARLFNADGGAVFFVSSNITTTCTTTNAFRVTNETVVRGLEAAYLAGKKVEIRLNGVCSGAFENATEVVF